MTLGPVVRPVTPDDLPASPRGRFHWTRSTAGVRWLMSDPDGGDAPVHLVARDSAGIVATLLVVGHRAKGHPFGQRRIIDVTATHRPAAIAAVGALLDHAIRHGRTTDAALLFAPACGPRAAALLASHGGFAQRRPNPAHDLRAKSRKHLPPLLDAREATGATGDSPLCLQWTDAPSSAER